MIYFCVHCDVAIVDVGPCPHCSAADPSTGTMSSKGVAMALFLGLNLVACTQEGSIEHVDTVQTDPTLKTEKSEASKKSKYSNSDSKAIESTEVPSNTVDPSLPTAVATTTTKSIQKEAVEVTPDEMLSQLSNIMGDNIGVVLEAPRPMISAKYGAPQVHTDYAERTRVEGTVVLGKITSDGSDEQLQSMQRTVRKHFTRFRYCYEVELNRNPNIEGAVILDVQIVEGRVQTVASRDDTLGNASLTNCIVTSVKRFKFPSDCTATIALPLQLSPPKE